MPPDTEVGNIEQRTACALGSTQAIQDVDPQRADIAALAFGHFRTIEPIQGFLEARRGEKAFADLLDRQVLRCPARRLHRDVSVNVAARIGNVFQGGRLHPLPVVMLAGMCMVEALAHHAFELVQAGRAERLRECSDHFAESKVFVSRE
jgi:hypothetical protein